MGNPRRDCAYFDRRALLQSHKKNLHAAHYASKSLFRNESYAVCINQADDQRESTPDSEYDEDLRPGKPCNYLAWRGTDDSDQAFEDIRNAAEYEITDSLEEANQEENS